MQKDKLRQVAGALYKIMKRDGRPWQDIELQRELIKGRVIGYDRICLVKRALQRDSRFRHWGGSYFVLAGSAQANASIMEFYRDRVKGILQENQKLFYRTIADELSRKLGFDVNPNHVNMALSKGRDFVRVGDGIYRLKGPEEEAHKPPDKSLTGWIVEAFRQEDRFMDMNDLCEALVKITGRQYHRTTLSGILSNGIYEFLGPVCGLWGLKDWKGRKESEAVKEILSMPLHCAITKDNFRTCAIAVPAKIGEKYFAQGKTLKFRSGLGSGMSRVPLVESRYNPEHSYLTGFGRWLASCRAEKGDEVVITPLLSGGRNTRTAFRISLRRSAPKQVSAPASKDEKEKPLPSVAIPLFLSLCSPHSDFWQNAVEAVRTATKTESETNELILTIYGTEQLIPAYASLKQDKRYIGITDSGLERFSAGILLSTPEELIRTKQLCEQFLKDGEKEFAAFYTLEQRCRKCRKTLVLQSRWKGAEGFSSVKPTCPNCGTDSDIRKMTREEEEGFRERENEKPAWIPSVPIPPSLNKVSVLEGVRDLFFPASLVVLSGLFERIRHVKDNTAQDVLKFCFARVLERSADFHRVHLREANVWQGFARNVGNFLRYKEGEGSKKKIDMDSVSDVTKEGATANLCITDTGAQMENGIADCLLIFAPSAYEAQRERDFVKNAWLEFDGGNEKEDMVGVIKERIARYSPALKPRKLLCLSLGSKFSSLEAGDIIGIQGALLKEGFTFEGSRKILKSRASPSLSSVPFTELLLFRKS